MAVKIQLRRGTTTQWNTTVDGIVGGTILAEGEVGVNTTTNQMKVGDGSTRWVNLPYFASGTITNVTAGDGITVNGTIGGSSTSGVTTVAVDTTYVVARNIINAKGDIIVGTADDTPTAFPVGATNGHALTVSSSAAAGVAWGQIVEAAIATGAVTTTKIADSNVTTAKIADSNVTTAKIADSNVTLAKLASAVQNLLIPAGTIAATVKSTADTGWLLLSGQTITSADTTYPSLWSAAPTSWKSGTSLVLPNLANRTLFQAGATTLGATGGSATIAETNLPSHTHAIDPPNTSVTITDPGHAHPESGRSTNAQSPGYLQRIGGSGANYDVQGTSTARWDAVTNPATASTTTGISASVNISSFTSGTGTGSGTAYYQPHLAVNYQIKAH